MNWFRHIKISQEIKTLILLRGVSGSGKSRLAKQFAPSEQIFSGDEFFQYGEDYKFDKSKLPEAHKWNQMRVQHALERGISPIVVDNTNTQFWEMKPYVQMALKNGYRVKFVEPHWDPQLFTPEGKWNVDFLAGKNIHGVDRETLQEMVNRYEYKPNIAKILSSKAPWEDELV